MTNLLFGKKFENEFSWSKSRDAMFRECLRKYYFNYYGSWGGWRMDSPKKTRQLYILKKLITRYMWIGSVVHSCIERSLKNLRHKIKPLPVEKIIEITMDMMRADFASSRRKLYRQNPKTLALFEHEYDIEIDNETWKGIALRTEKCLRNFYNSAVYQNLYDLPREYWLEIEELSSFMLDGIKVFVVLDCSYRTGGGFYIYDWKTGKNDEQDANIQLSSYALYAQQKWKADFKDINVTAFNLGDNTLYDIKVSDDLVRWVRAYIAGSVSDMKKLLRSQENNEAVEQDFARTTNKRQCQRCNFKKVCIGE